MTNPDLYNQPCLSMYPFSNILITKSMHVFEVYVNDDTNWKGISPEENGDDYKVRLLPMKANINWNEWYGDDGKNNWFNDRVPVIQQDGILYWDY